MTSNSRERVAVETPVRIASTPTKSRLMSAQNNDLVVELSAPPPSPKKEEAIANEQRELIPVLPAAHLPSTNNFTPVPPPAHLPSNNSARFKRRKFRTSPRSSETSSDTSTSSQVSSCDASLTTSKVASQTSIDRLSTVSKLPKLYLGKDMHVGTLGQFGPGMYDVRCSKTGSPHGVPKGTPRMGNGSRFDRGKCYEGKENEHMLLGQFGPGLYDIRCFKTGTRERSPSPRVSPGRNKAP